MMEVKENLKTNIMPQASQLQNPPPPPSSTKSGRLFGKGGIGELHFSTPPMTLRAIVISLLVNGVRAQPVLSAQPSLKCSDKLEYTLA